MKQIQSFSEFHAEFKRKFTIFFAVPILSVKPEDSGLNQIKRIVILIALGAFWGGIVISFVREHQNNDQISLISNWIQLLANAVALTTTLFYCANKHTDLNNILGGFEKIDKQLRQIGQTIDYRAHLKTGNKIIWAVIIVLATVIEFDFYVTITLYQMISVWYWSLWIFPLICYSMALLHTVFFIHWIEVRCRLLDNVLTTTHQRAVSSASNNTLRNNVGSPLLLTNRGDQLVTNKTHSHLQSHCPATIALMTKSMNLMMTKPTKSTKATVVVPPGPQPYLPDEKLFSQLFSIMADLCKLSSKVDAYYGLFFLSVIAALFTCTSIQVYYCYVNALGFDEKRKLTLMTLIVSINLIIVNLGLIVAICTVCERVSNEASNILHNFSATQIHTETVSKIMSLFGPMQSMDTRPMAKYCNLIF